MIKAVVYDFDGVIVDTEKNRFDELRKMLKKDNLHLKASWFKEIIGKKTGHFLREKFPDLTQSAIDKIISLRRKSIIKNTKKIKAMPGIEKTIKSLSKKYVLALTTGSPKNIVLPLLKQLSIRKYFKIIIAGEDFRSSKPNPECYIKTIKKLKMNSSEIIVIEDSKAGIIAAKKAGCKVIALQTKYNKNQIGKANKIFRSHSEIYKYLEQIK
jgi:beta-phosphoglucomutase